MNGFLARATVAGALALGGIAFGAGAASAQNCMGLGGGTDCPLQPGVPLQAQPGNPGPGVWTPPPQPGYVAPPNRRWNRAPGYGGGYPGGYYGGGYHGGGYYGPGYTDRYVPEYRPRYRYAEPRYYEPDYDDRSLTAAHVQWCFDRYKTYRVSDNTYKPSKNTRRECISPYS